MVGVCGEKSSRRRGPKGGLAPEEEKKILGPIKCAPFNLLNPELNPICYLLALLALHFLQVSRIRVK